MPFIWPKINWLKIINTILIIVSIFLIVFFTRFQTASWNDGSRFATIQNLVENHSFSIDHSLFFTFDKVYINGHFYSDKPPLFSMVATLPYYFFHITGHNFVDHPRSFVFLTNIFILFLPLTIFVCCLYFYLQKYSDFSKDKSLLLALFFCLGTAIFPFATVLTNHFPATLLVGFSTLILFYKIEEINYYFVFLSGILLGLGATFDLGVIFISASFFLYVLFLKGFKKESFKLLFYYSSGFIIPILIHWWFNYGITGDILPASMHPEFFIYSGSKFTKDNLTGSGPVVHSFVQWIKYVWLLTFGKHGVFSHNPLIAFGLVSTLYFLFIGNKKIRYFCASVVFSVLSLVLYYSLYGQGAGGGSYTVRWLLILTPLFFPILAYWAKQSRINLTIIIILAVLSFFINLLAVGNVIGSVDPLDNYSIVHMLAVFPDYAGRQYVVWSEMLKIK